MMLYIGLGISFLVYHFILFDFSEKLYDYKPNKLITRTILFVLNSIILSVCYILRPHAATVMVVFVIVIYIEIKLIYKEKLAKNLFVAISFGINLFAVRLIVKCVIAFVNDLHIYDITQNVQLDMISTIIALICCSLYIKLIIVVVPEKNAKIMISGEENLLHAASALALVYAFLIFNTTNLYITEEYPLFTVMQMKIGVSAIIGYFAAITYTFLHNKSKLFRQQSFEIQSKIEMQEKENEHLTYIAYRDETVGCYNRTFGMEYLAIEIDNHYEVLSVALFDLDGLKDVNDKFGHAEGDIYIKTVTNTLNNTFSRFRVCRMGGDEFMVIMPDCDTDSAQRYCLQAYKTVEELCDTIDKKYRMSISYGILEVDQQHTVPEILEIVDKRMYEFKKRNKATRVR